ncbi:MAG: MBL fold metallo-hydrolase [Clostridia bacterium]|nr:MBL fold metallo-hydrolase [Clostridia bacterium]
MKQIISLVTFLILCFSLPLSSFAEEKVGQLQIHFCSLTPGVKESVDGDCALIIFPNGETMLVDCGMLYCVDRITQWLHGLGVTGHIDYFVCSHHHQDHIGAFAGLTEHFTFGRVMGANWSPEIGNAMQAPSYFKKLTELNMTEERLRAGDTLDIGDVHIDVLWPMPDSDLSVDEQMMDPDFAGKQNDYALVFRLVYGEFSALFTGDVEYTSQTELANLYGMDGLESTLLKSPHHGNQMGEDFMDCVYPYVTFVTNDYEPWKQISKILDIYSMHSYFYSINEGLSVWTDGTLVSFQAEEGDTKLYTYDLTEE